MSNDARLRLKWKVDLLSYLKPFRVYCLTSGLG